MDIFSKKIRSQIMSRIRSTNSRPEMLVRRLVFRLGYRYRLHSRDVPGSPDLVFRFWHQHTNCPTSHMPKSRTQFWKRKLEGNKLRDQRIRKELRRTGWKVLTLWECELKNTDKLESRIVHFLESGYETLPGRR
jgi:DNA mismatch endonuclease, patch repair protein